MINILVVEDNEKTLRFCAEIIEQIFPSIQVYPVATGEEAILILNAQRINGVFIDLELPGIDGFTLARRIRSSKRYHMLPIIFETAADKDMPETYKAYHNFDYISKPFSRDEFAKMVEKMVCEINNLFETRGLNLEKVISARNGGETRIIKYNDIYFAEVVLRKLQLVARTGIFPINGFNLTDFMSYVGDTMFVKCSKSCALNVNNITKIASVTRKTWDVYFNEEQTIKCELSANNHDQVVALCNTRYKKESLDKNEHR
jgi:DNA-binding LytR/AlgR family response regulator